MKKKILILDYGLGNLFSITQACEAIGIDVIVSKDIIDIKNADAIILPGVGAFGDAMNSLNQNNLIIPIKEFIATGKPFLGICLGMQLLFTKSEEFGENAGLNLIKGEIKKFPQENKIYRVPQIQWNKIYQNDADLWGTSPLKNIKNGEYMYFVHSYYAIPEDKSVILSYTNYGDIKYASSVIKDNVIGIQFHPEKSAEEGLKIYKEWINIINKID
jgi:glutamine amidotransferase